MRLVQLVAVVVLIGLVASALPPMVHGAPTLQTDQPLYTLRGKQVGLEGSGYGSQSYFVWVKAPDENRTQYTGTSFTPVSGGLIPPNIVLPINASDPLGTYRISISTSEKIDSQETTAHFGIWGTVKPLYERTQSVKILGGGLYPGTSFKLSIRDSAGDYVQTATIVTDTQGYFNQTWRVPENAVIDAYKVIIDGTGTYDNAQQDYVSEARFTVTQALLSVEIVTLPSSSYQRTETASISMTIKYPDGSPVLKSKADILPVLLLRNQSTINYATLVLTDSANGIWTSQIKIPVNATSSPRYRFELPAASFDDGFGNKGGSADTFSDYFQVRNASLLFTSQLNGTQIQVPFGQVSIISKISYPDGTPFFNGTARVRVFTGSSTSDVRLSYDPAVGAWRGAYSSAFTDLWRIGVWKLQVVANDTYGNSGTETYEVATQPYFFIVLIAAIIIIALFGRWMYARYGRKVYFKVRKIVMRFRGFKPL